MRPVFRKALASLAFSWLVAVGAGIVANLLAGVLVAPRSALVPNPTTAVPPERPIWPLTDLAIAIEQVTPADASARVRLSIRPPEESPVSVLADSTTGQRVVGPNGQIKDAYRDASIEVQLMDRDTKEFSFAEFPLKDVAGHQAGLARPKLTAAAVILPLDGHPADFPQDRYDAHLTITMQLPAPLILVPTLGENRGSYFLPFQTEVAGRSLPDRQVRVTRSSNWQVAYWSEDMDLVVERPRATVAYAYLMACLPIVFGMLFVVAFLFDSRSREQSLPTQLAGLVAPMLAVLPVRAVLVPPEIPGLTRIDMLLGLALALMTAAAIVRYVGEATWWRADHVVRAGPDDPLSVATADPEVAATEAGTKVQTSDRPHQPAATGKKLE